MQCTQPSPQQSAGSGSSGRTGGESLGVVTRLSPRCKGWRNCKAKPPGVGQAPNPAALGFCNAGRGPPLQLSARAKSLDDAVSGFLTGELLTQCPLPASNQPWPIMRNAG